jgi:hypothetical protein
MRSSSGRQPPALIVMQPQTANPELFVKHPALLAPVVDHLALVLVHPAGEREQDGPERIENWGHLVPCREPQACEEPA